MQRSTSRILTTHTGSLPRSPELQELLRAKQEQRPVDNAMFDAAVRKRVAEVVAQQVNLGLDVINDGEQGRESYVLYVRDRLTGFEGERRIRSWPSLDRADFPEFFARGTEEYGRPSPQPACTGPIGWKEGLGVHKDIENLQTAAAAVEGAEVFMTAASPGVIAFFLPNEYYPSEEAYLYALADVMKDEYQAIVAAGLVLQLDCPDLAFTRVNQFAHLTIEEFKKVVELRVEVINYALAGLPPEQMRMHICWGNRENPHAHDVPLKEIIHLVLRARPAGLSFEGANPRHAHEWKIWRDVQLPEGKVIIPGVLDTTTNFIEHPELVAERTIRYAELVGRENVIVGSDCGFGTSAWRNKVDTKIVWAKLRAMVEGAQLASQQLW
ncbi:MAG: cobalamin-independent methionine synthase II family protein [candidate division NC10 bacterium]|nr:cobalamin-independent methionine synthase II family protein [candidate division NC10 bacterium]